MSVELLINPDEDGESDEGYEVAPVHAWGKFVKWAERQDGGKFPALLRFAEHGFTVHAPLLQEELEALA